uniref:Retrotransposon protein, putative, unclassified n=2 Tax=Oryza sativa subsp. japonica TaxID=39947 RepID=Q2R7S4_ORYSJ|nr:retrotransposon protein, putative, unclassified [Oryza sativa Japonica Group]ABA92515.1 retrotransposon protein, putative, unclassified [Oryza sativa Japonica Group]
METRNGTVVQKYKVKLVADVPGTCSSKDGEGQQVPAGTNESGGIGIAEGSGDKGDGFQEGQVEDLGLDGNGLQPQFNNFQDRIDYTVQHALINQSRVLVNTLSNMVKSLVDCSIAEYQATGPVYLPGGVFPNYRPLITNNQPSTSNVPPAQPTAPVSAPRQITNPRLLEQVAAMFLPNPPAADPALSIQQTPPRQQITQPIQQQGLLNASAGLRTPDNQLRQHVATQVVPEHLVHNVQPDQSVIPQVIPEHLVRNIQPNFQNYQGGNLNYQYQPPSPHVQYQRGDQLSLSLLLSSINSSLYHNKCKGCLSRGLWADLIVDVIREQFGLKPKDTGNLYRHPYLEWFERVQLPNRYKVPDFSKFSGQDNVSTYEHVSRFIAQCGEASAVDALRVRLFPLSLSGTASTWFSSLPYNSINSWADLEKQFHSYFYSGVHDEAVQDYIQRFREMRNRCYSLSLTDSQLADLAFQGLIAPNRGEKVTLHEQRFAEAKKNFKKINHVYPYMYGSDDDDDDSEVAAAEWVRSKKVVPCPWVKSSGKEERFDFDITKADKIFDLLLREKRIQLPAGHIIPSAEELGKRRYCKWNNSGSHSTNDCKCHDRN